MAGKQGTIIGLMLAAVGLLLMGQFFAWVQVRPPETGLVRLHVEEPILISGQVTAEERPVDVPQGDRWTLCVQPGQQVAAGQVLYQEKRPRELEALALSVRLLRGASEAEEAAVSRRRDLLAAIGGLNSSGLRDRPEQAEQVASLVLAEQEKENLAADLDRAETLLLGYGTEMRDTVTAAAAGIFTGSAIVTGDRWYLEAELPVALEPGETLEAELLGGVFETVTLTAEASEDGKTVLSCGECLFWAVQQEQITAKIFKDSETGLEIPARAVYTVGEETGVYVVSGDSFRWRPVTILYMEQDKAIVQPSAALSPGDRVRLEG